MNLEVILVSFFYGKEGGALSRDMIYIYYYYYYFLVMRLGIYLKPLPPFSCSLIE